MFDVLKWRLLGKRSRWPRFVPAQTGFRPSTCVEGLQITHVGHSSYLVQTNSRNILVDPVWAERASPIQWVGPRRHNPPAIHLKDLPPIHTVLVTHNHYDHLDTTTLRRLWETYRPQIFAPLGNDAIIRAAAPEIDVQTGDWWADFVLSNNTKLTIVPSYHWSSRRVADRRMALWGGFVLETPEGAIYCAGDTAYRDGAVFRTIGNRFGPPEVAILPIGAYAPRWFMQTQHANPEEAVQIALDCGAKQVLGIHWGTFALTDEPFEEPAEQLRTVVEAKGLNEERFRALRPGDIWKRGLRTTIEGVG